MAKEDLVSINAESAERLLKLLVQAAEAERVVYAICFIAGLAFSYLVIKLWFDSGKQKAETEVIARCNDTLAQTNSFLNDCNKTNKGVVAVLKSLVHDYNLVRR